VKLEIRGTSTRGLIPLRSGQAHYRPNLTLTYTYLPVYLGIFFSAFAKLRKATIRFMMYVLLSVSLSVCPHGTIRLPMDEFS